VLRHGSKLLYGYSIFRAPKVTVLLRRSYGGANLVMGGRGMRPDFAFAWPDVEMAPTGPDTVIQAVFNKDLEQAMKEGGKEKYDEVYSKYREALVKGFSIWQWARSWTCMYTVHEIIDPRDTRRKICKALETAEHKDEWVELPDRKHGVEPF